MNQNRSPIKGKVVLLMIACVAAILPSIWLISSSPAVSPNTDGSHVSSASTQVNDAISEEVVKLDRPNRSQVIGSNGQGKKNTAAQNGLIPGSRNSLASRFLTLNSKFTPNQAASEEGRPTVETVGEVGEGTPATGEEKAILQLSNTPLPFILLEYEKLSGKRVIRDASLETLSISIETGVAMSPSETLDFLEKTLLLNGVAIIPDSEGLVKAIPFQPARLPQSEAIPLVANIKDLEDGDRIVTYVMTLDHLSTEEAVTVFEKVVPRHSYGTITPVPEAKKIIITESASVIRRLSELKSEIDLSPEETIQESYELERADATMVAEAIIEILGVETKGSGSSSGRRPTATSGQRDPNVPADPAALAALYDGSTGGSAPPATIRAIARTNKILAIARPVDHLYIRELIEEFDAATEMRRIYTADLRFVNVIDFLPIAEDAILRGMVEEGGASGADSSSRPQLPDSGRGSRSSTNSSSGGGDSALNRGVSLEEPEDPGGPVSALVGKTLLVADPQSNQLSISGPPEHIEAIKDLIKIVDQRPRQVYISTVIGQLTLGDDQQTGVDILRQMEGIEFDGQNSQIAGINRNRTGGILDPGILNTVENFLPAAAGLTLYGEIGRHLDVFVSALQSTNKFEVLSRPSIFAVNNRKAVIATGQKIAVPTSSLTSLNQGVGNQGAVTSTIDFRDVVLKLEVVPLINSADEVTLTISQVNDEIVGSTNIGGNDIPTIGTQEMVTSVIVPSGQTVLLGGLVTESSQETDSGLPMLVNVPILKHIFGRNSKTSTRRELVIFIQPHVINGADELRIANDDMRARTEVGDPSLEFTQAIRPALPLPEYDHSGSVPPNNYIFPSDADELPAPQLEKKEQGTSRFRSRDRQIYQHRHLR